MLLARNDPLKHREYKRRYYERNKQLVIDRAKQWALANPEKMKNAIRQWRANNPERNRANARAYHQRRRTEDPSWSIVLNLRRRLTRWLVKSQGARADTTLNLVGCSIKELKYHIESQFQPGMTWDNRRLWHIDHIRPCASFDLTDPAQQRACFHYMNLQPLWACDNQKKGKRLGLNWGKPRLENYNGESNQDRQPA